MLIYLSSTEDNESEQNTDNKVNDSFYYVTISCFQRTVTKTFKSFNDMQSV